MSSYNKADLARIAKESGFIRDNLEKVIRLTDILKYFNTNLLLAESLALKGGTAINLTVFDLPRLSVDIDLDFVQSCGKDEMLAKRVKINEEVLNHMLVQGYSFSSDTKNPHSLDSWSFCFQNAGGNKDNIKIEVNYSMRNHIYPLVKAKIGISFLPVTEVQTLASLELFGSKIKALIERTASRDLYDVYNMIKSNIFSESQLKELRKAVLFYLAVGGTNPPKTEYSFDAIDKLIFKNIKTSLIPVLRKSDLFDFEKAKKEVKDFLSRLLVLDEDEKKFMGEFNKKSYKPELLFEDPEIFERIKDHPMALWKTLNRQ